MVLTLALAIKNDQSCATFVHFTAHERKESLQNTLSKCRFFFSLQADGTTDTANITSALF